MTFTIPTASMVTGILGAVKYPAQPSSWHYIRIVHGGVEESGNDLQETEFSVCPCFQSP